MLSITGVREVTTFLINNRKQNPPKTVLRFTSVNQEGKAIPTFTEDTEMVNAVHGKCSSCHIILSLGKIRNTLTVCIVTHDD